MNHVFRFIRGGGLLPTPAKYTKPPGQTRRTEFYLRLSTFGYSLEYFNISIFQYFNMSIQYSFQYLSIHLKILLMHSN